MVNNNITDFIIVKNKHVKCDGISYNTIGHPLIYLNMGSKNQVTCPYCSRQFIYKPLTHIET
ncbi:MAG: zinc-finger domain-containing protein [Rickettsiales endosymbiont of Dermacentor nuttalli]